MNRQETLYESLKAFMKEDLETANELLSKVTQDISKEIVKEMCGDKHDDDYDKKDKKDKEEEEEKEYKKCPKCDSKMKYMDDKYVCDKCNKKD